jgi:hypothetical protein
MVIYKNIKFSDYVDLWSFLVYKEENLSVNMERMFPHSSIFYMRAHLEEKFQRKFTVMEIKKLIAEELALKNINLDSDFIERSPSSILN